MARVDVFRRIKNDKIIEGRIQKYRLHFDYLKTCLEYSEFKVDKKHYSSWKLNLVKTLSFNKWWSQHGQKIFEQELDQIKEVKNTRQSNSSTFIEIPNDTPVEYALEKVRDILQSKKIRVKNNIRLRPLELQIYLEAFKERKKKKSLLDTAKVLSEKRQRIAKTLKGKALMSDTRANKFLNNKTMDYFTIQRIIIRYNTKAKKILNNVCNGQFPGNY